MKEKAKFLILYIFLITAIIFSICIGVMFNDEKLVFNNKLLFSYNDNWTYTDNNGNTNVINLPQKVQTPEGKETVISNKLPDNYVDEMAICIRTSQQSLRVLLDGKEIYSYGIDTNLFWGKAEGSAWHLIRIPYHKMGGNITLILSSPYKNFSGNINSITYGSKGALISKIIKENGLSLLASFLMFLLAIVLLIFYFINKRFGYKDFGLVYLTTFSFLISIWLFGESKMSQFFIGNQSFITAISVLSITLCAIPMLLFVEKACINSNKKVFDFLYIILALSFVISFLLQIFNIADFVESMLIYHICVFISFVFVCVIVGMELFKYKNKTIRPIAISILILIVSGVFELINFYFNDFVNVSMYVKIGLLLFVSYFTVFFAKKVIEIAKKTEELVYYEKLAYTDFLTKCKNRTAFNVDFEKLSNNTNEYKKIYIVLMDLNNLKSINDNFGHLVGDDALIACYDCIDNAFGSSGNNYRIGGDEFVCIIKDITKEEFLKKIENFKECIYIQTKKSPYPFNIAAGYAEFDSTVDKNLYDTFNRADKEMYNNKNDIKNF